MAKGKMQSVLVFSGIHLFVCLGLLWIQYLCWFGSQFDVIPEVMIIISTWMLRIATFPFSLTVWLVPVNEMYMFAAGTSVIILLFSSCFWGLIDLWMCGCPEKNVPAVLK